MPKSSGGGGRSGRSGGPKEPYQMTRAEWERAIEAAYPENVQTPVTKASASPHLAALNEVKRLTFGVRASDSARLKAAMAGKIKMSGRGGGGGTLPAESDTTGSFPLKRGMTLQAAKSEVRSILTNRAKRNKVKDEIIREKAARNIKY